MVVSVTHCIYQYPLLGQGFQVAASVFLLKGHTIESMYYNIYKKPRVNLKEEIWEEGDRWERMDPKKLSHCKPNRPTTRLTSCFWKGRKYTHFEKFRSKVLWNMMRKTSVHNWQQPWREVLGTLIDVQVKSTLEQPTKAQKESKRTGILISP